MATRKFEKALISCLSWAIFLYLLIRNWDALKSVWWWNLWETTKISGIGEFLKQNTGDVFFFGLCTSIIIPLLWRFFGRTGNKVSEHQCFKSSDIAKEIEYNIEGQPTLGHLTKELNMDVTLDPALSSMPCNIYHPQYKDHHSKEHD